MAQYTESEMTFIRDLQAKDTPQNEIATRLNSARSYLSENKLQAQPTQNEIASRGISSAKGAVALPKHGIKKTFSGGKDILQSFSGKTLIETERDGVAGEERRDIGDRTFANRTRQFLRGVSRVTSGALTTGFGVTPVGIGVGAGIGAIEPEVQQAVDSFVATPKGKATVEFIDGLSPSQKEGFMNIGEALPFLSKGGAGSLAGGLEKSATPVIGGKNFFKKSVLPFADDIAETGKIPEGSKEILDATIKENLATQTLPGLAEEASKTIPKKVSYVERITNPTLDESEALLLSLGDEGTLGFAEHVNQAKRVMGQEGGAGRFIEKTPFGLAGERGVEAFENIAKQRKVVGKQIEEGLMTRGEGLVNVQPLLAEFDNGLEVFGLKIGEKGKLKPIKGVVPELTSADNATLSSITDVVQVLRSNPTALNLQKLRRRIRNIVSQKQASQLSKQTTPADRLLETLSKELDDASFDVLGKEFGVTKQEYAILKDVESELNKALGDKGRHGESIMKAVVKSPARGAKFKNLFDEVKRITGIDLQKEAAFAEIAMVKSGDPRAFSLLETTLGKDSIAGALADVASTTFFGKAFQFAKKLVEGDPLDEALKFHNEAIGKSKVKPLKPKDVTFETSIDDVGGLGKAGKASTSLVEQAKKFKTADEFVKAQGEPLYHGTTKGNSFTEFDESKLMKGNRGKAVYLTSNKDAANYFGQLKEETNFLRSDAFRNATGRTPVIGEFKPEILKFYLSPDAKVKVLNKLPQRDAEKIISELKKEGYEAVRFAEDVLDRVEGMPFVAKAYKNGKAPDTTIVFNKSIIKTKSQLTDIFNKANNKAGTANKSFGTNKTFITKAQANKITSELKEIYKKVPIAKVGIDKIANKITKELDGLDVAAPSLKTKESAFRKIVDEYENDTTRIKDIARNTIVVLDEKSLPKALEALKKAGASEFKHTLADSNPLGFSGINTKFKINGTWGEIQVNTPDMIYGKELAKDSKAMLGDLLYNKMNTKYKGNGAKGHLFYEEYRIIEPTTARAKQIAKESTEYYKQFR